MRSNSLPPISINSTEWWLKPIAMLQHNWALIEDTDNSTVVYFLHDGGNTLRFNKLKNGFTDEGIVVDSIEFSTKALAIEALRKNGFMLEAEFQLARDDYRPRRPFFDGRMVEDGIYSKQGYWIE